MNRYRVESFSPHDILHIHTLYNTSVNEPLLDVLLFFLLSTD
jgi:hypothetical protein